VELGGQDQPEVLGGAKGGKQRLKVVVMLVEASMGHASSPGGEASRVRGEVGRGPAVSGIVRFAGHPDGHSRAVMVHADPVNARFVTTTDNTLLPAVRQTLVEAGDALMTVAFVNEAGVSLIGRQLKSAPRARLLRTTVFSRGGTLAALKTAKGLGVEVRVLNPGGGTYHSKIYLGGNSAVIGSANLTGGLLTNVESGVLFRGDQVVRDARDWAEARWDQGVPWDARAPLEAPDGRLVRSATTFADSPELLVLIKAEVAKDPVFETLKSRARNEVLSVTDVGLLVATDRSPTGKLVDAWMVIFAWQMLVARGRLENDELLNQLYPRVMRSSFVCALLARLPGVRVGPEKKITLCQGGAGMTDDDWTIPNKPTWVARPITVAPRGWTIPTYRKYLCELTPTQVRELGTAMESATGLLEAAGQRAEAAQLEELAEFLDHEWVCGASFAFFVPGAETWGETEQVGRRQARVAVGHPWDVRRTLVELVLEHREADRLVHQLEQPRHLYVGVACSLRHRLKAHDGDRGRGRNPRLVPVYETGDPEFVCDVEKWLIKWAKQHPDIVSENVGPGGEGVGGGHGAYWVYVMFLDSKPNADEG
jgi:hypothetical protein